MAATILVPLVTLTALCGKLAGVDLPRPADCDGDGRVMLRLLELVPANQIAR
jgi:hypothetical protein